MCQDAIFVSCDIIGHSNTDDPAGQRDRIIGLNGVVRQTILRAQRDTVSWLSGGDGGHAVFWGNEGTELALGLIVALRAWSQEAGVPLRITGNTGLVETLPGLPRCRGVN